MKELEGRWWIPTDPEQKVIGTLSICKRDGLRLRISTDEGSPNQGTLHYLAHHRSMNDTDRTCSLVHGQSFNGRLFTLYDGFVHSKKPGFFSLNSATIYFNKGIEGDLIEQPSAFKTDSVFVRFHGLEKWLDIRHFTVDQERYWKDVSIKFIKPDDFIFKISPERELRVTWSRKGPSQSIAQTHIGMKVIPWFSIKYSSPTLSEQVLEDIFVLGDLLSILIGKPTSVSKINLYSPDHTFQLGETTRQIKLKAIGVFTEPPESFKKQNHFDFLFPFQAVSEGFESIAQKWFASRTQWWAFIVPYLAFQRSPASLAERQFFDFASVAESLHSQLCPDDLTFPDQDAQDIWKAIKQVIPQERKGHYSSVLKRVNALTYQDRLIRLLGKFPSLCKDVIGDQGQQLLFCQKVKELRNTEAHRLPRSSKNKAGGLALIRIASKLKVIIDAWIFAELGIAESVIEKAMRDCRKYWFYASCSTWPWNVNE